MMQKIIMAIIFGLIACVYAQNMGKKPDEGYRIEVVVDTLEEMPGVRFTKPKELRFISPEGKVIKKMPYGWRQKSLIVSPNLRYLIKIDETPAVLKKDSLGKWKRLKEPKVKFSYMNAKGQEKWHKEYEVENLKIKVPEGFYEGETTMPYFLEISQDGTRIVFVRTRTISEYRSDVVVLDTLGSEVASVYDTYGIENAGSLEISPDGSIVGADVFFPPDSTQRSMKHLFFLDVETGRTKIVKAEGKKWGSWYALYPEMAAPVGKIYIGWGIYADPKKRERIKGGHLYLTFDELPDDLSILFGGDQ